MDMTEIKEKAKQLGIQVGAPFRARKAISPALRQRRITATN